MIKNLKILFLYVIYLNPSNKDRKFLIPNQLGEGIFYWDHDKQEVVNGSDRPGLIVGVGNYDTQILPIQTQHAKFYTPSYNKGMYKLLNLTDLLDNSLKNNSVLHTNNFVKINNKLLLDGINKKQIIFRKIFVDDLNNKNSLIPLEIIWTNYKNLKEKEKLITINETIVENFDKKEEIQIIDNKEYKYKLMCSTKWTTENQIDNFFNALNSSNRGILQNRDFYKNKILENENEFKKELNSSRIFLSKVFVNYIDRNIKNKKWLTLINNDKEYKEIWKDYNEAKDFIKPNKSIIQKTNEKERER